MTIPAADKAGAARAGLWSTLDLALRQGMQFVVSIILARLLTPADFGVIAIMSFFTSLAVVFVQSGFATALIQRAEVTHEEESAMFWFGTAVALAAALLLGIASAAIARLYGQPVLQPLLVIAGIQIVLSALGSVHGALLARRLRFDLTMISGITASVVSGVIGVAMAMTGWGVWALAAQTTAAMLVSTAILWLVLPWRPAWRFRPSVLRPLLGFGSWVSLSSVIDVIYTQGSALLIAKLYGVRDLGLYNRAAATQQLPTGLLTSIIGRVALPLFSARAADPAAVRRGLASAIGMVMLVNVPAMVGLSLLAEPVVVTLFGEQWRPSAPILSILALGGVLFPVHALNLQALLAFGGSARFFRVEIAKKSIGIAFVVIGVFFGIEGLAWAYVALSVATIHLNTAPIGQRIGYGTVDQLRDLSHFVLPTLAMAGAVWAARTLPAAGSSELAELALAVPAGALAYAAAAAALRVPAFYEAFAVMRGMVGREAGNSEGSAG